MNPNASRYQKWLGLHQRRPDYFELLCIAPNVTDSDLIKQAAKSALKKLGEEPSSDNDQEDWKALRSEIKEAYRCLSNDASRAEYLANLLLAAKNSAAADVELDSQITNKDLETVANEFHGESVIALDSSDSDDIPLAVPVATIVPPNA